MMMMVESKGENEISGAIQSGKTNVVLFDGNRASVLASLLFTSIETWLRLIQGSDYILRSLSVPHGQPVKVSRTKGKPVPKGVK